MDYKKMAEAIRHERRLVWKMLGEPDTLWPIPVKSRQLGFLDLFVQQARNAMLKTGMSGPWQDFVQEKKMEFIRAFDFRVLQRIMFGSGRSSGKGLYSQFDIGESSAM